MAQETGGDAPNTAYPPAVVALTTFGPVSWTTDTNEWPNYADVGVRAEHIGVLIRLATELSAFEDFCNGNVPETYAPIHACRALAQLRAGAAVEPLVNFLAQLPPGDWPFEWEDISEWMHEEWPAIFGLLGPTAIPPLSRLLRDATAHDWARALAANSLAQIAELEPPSRAACLAPILEVFAQYDQNDDWLNAMLTFPLCALKASEAAALIEQAFAAGRIDELMAWDLGLIRYELGLAEWPYGRS